MALSGDVERLRREVKALPGPVDPEAALKPKDEFDWDLWAKLWEEDPVGCMEATGRAWDKLIGRGVGK